MGNQVGQAVSRYAVGPPAGSRNRGNAETGQDPHGDLAVRWIALSVTLCLWAMTWPQILPREADLPPCHMMGLIALAGGWTLVEFEKARKAKKR